MGDNVNLRVERDNSQVAMIYFANDQENIIRIPPGITVRNVTNNSIVRPSRLGGWFYLISWISSYEIYHDNVHIVSLDNQKQQAIRENDNFLYYTTDSDDNRTEMMEAIMMTIVLMIMTMMVVQAVVLTITIIIVILVLVMETG
jgi:hypothetical protein